jgi:S1-C subfamily serine protease
VKVADRDDQDISGRRGKHNVTHHLAIFLSAGLVLIAGGLWRAGSEEPVQDAGIAALETLQRQLSGLQSALSQNELQSIQQTMADVARQSAPLVVAVSPRVAEPVRTIPVYGTDTDARAQAPVGLRLPSTQSGILIDQEGYILTSAAIVEFGTEFEVAFDTSRHAADLTSFDPGFYLALLKLREPPPVAAALNYNPSRNLQAGEWLIKQGRVASSGESRSAAILESLRTAANGTTIGELSGDSGRAMDGAAVIDISGQIVGIQVIPPESSPIVVPIASALAIGQSLKNQPAAVPQSWTGLQLQELTDDLKEHFSAPQGIFVAGVAPGSAAAKAGLRTADVIQKIDGAEVSSAKGVLEFINAVPPGTILQLTIRRNSREQVLPLATEPRAGTATAARPPTDESTLSIRLNPSPNPGEGLVIAEIGPVQLANRLGVKTGDFIRSVNLRTTMTIAQFRAVQRTVAEGESQLWEIRRGDQTFFLAVKQKVEAL